MKKLKLHLSGFDTEISIELDSDSTVTDMYDAFERLLLGVGYQQQSINNFYKDAAEALEE